MALVGILARGRVPSRALVSSARRHIQTFSVGAGATGARGVPITFEMLAALLLLHGGN